MVNVLNVLSHSDTSNIAKHGEMEYASSCSIAQIFMTNYLLIVSFE
jgi:hypothetical protein